MGVKHVGGHDMVRRVDRNGEALVWCRKCSGHARHRLGPKLDDLLLAGEDGQKEYGKMIIRILILEDGR